MRGRVTCGAAAVGTLLAGLLMLTGCGSAQRSIVIDGSSTVAPLTAAAAEDYAAAVGGANISVATSGTGGGFQRFCAADTDISDASRPINDDEVRACERAGVEYLELRVASDGITVVTGANAAVGADNLTLAQLKAVWEKGSRITNWDQIPDGHFANRQLTLAGAGSQSGTYDFFNETVLGDDQQTGRPAVPRQDYTASEDDNVTVRAVAGSQAGLGYLGFSHYEENRDILSAFAVDGVPPTTATITDGSYPLSRPLFIYVNRTALADPEVNDFVRYYLAHAEALAHEQQFVPAPRAILAQELADLPKATAR